MKQVILIFSLVFASNFLEAAESVQSLDILKNKIEQYVMASLSSQQQDSKIQVTVDKIDSRLKLKPCTETNLEVFNPFPTSTARATTMGIRCQANDNRWTIYVPVRVNIHKSVLVAKRTLPKGTKISKDDIDIEQMDVSQLKQGFFTQPEQVIDQICKTSISQGNAIAPPLLQTASLVHKGEQVTIHALNEYINVSMEGVALSEGGVGDTIQVKNLSSKKIIEAEITAKHTVKVPL